MHASRGIDIFSYVLFPRFLCTNYHLNYTCTFFLHAFVFFISACFNLVISCVATLMQFVVRVYLACLFLLVLCCSGLAQHNASVNSVQCHWIGSSREHLLRLLFMARFQLIRSTSKKMEVASFAKKNLPQVFFFFFQWQHCCVLLTGSKNWKRCHRSERIHETENEVSCCSLLGISQVKKAPFLHSFW